MTDPVLTLLIPRALHSPNRDRGHHWSTRHTLTKVWELEIMAALRRVPRWREWLITPTAPQRRRLIITRLCPNRSHFIQDSDNRMFAGKGIRDCLVRLHLLVDDKDRWLESVVVDDLHPERQAATIVRLEWIAPMVDDIATARADIARRTRETAPRSPGE